MYPHERSLVEEMKDRPFALIGVNNDPLERAKKAVSENELNWRSFQDEPGGGATAITKAWGIKGWPTIVVLDAEMQIHYRGHNGVEATAIAKRLVDALDKKTER